MTDSPTVTLAATVERLRLELEELRRSQRARTVVEQAKGLLAERLGCGVEDAHDHLLDLATEAEVDPAVAAALLLGSTLRLPPGETPTATDIFDPATYLPQQNGHTPAPTNHWTSTQTPPTPDVALHTPPAYDPAPDHTIDDQAGADGDYPALAGGAVPGPRDEPGGLPAPLAAARHLAAAAFAESRTADELARRLAEEAFGWLGAQSVLLTVLEPDGALRVAGAYGLPAHIISKWARIPPHAGVGVVRALRDGAPLWVPDPDSIALVGRAAGHGGPSSCLPLISGGRIVGAAEVSWRQGSELDSGARRYVSAVTVACAQRLRRLAPTAGSSTDAPWLRAVLDAVPGPSALLSPVRDAGGRVVDFNVDAVNADATDRPGQRPEDLVGVHLLEAYPGLALHDLSAPPLFDAYVRVLETGTPLRRGPREYASLAGGRVVNATMSVRACRIGDGLLVSWQFHDDSADLAAQLDQAQRLGNLGWSRWDLSTGDIHWSDQLYNIFGRARSDGPLTVEGLATCVLPDDLPHAEHLMRTLLGRREAADVEFRIRRGREVRHLRVMAEPVLDAAGEPAALHTVFQDVTHRRRTDEMLATTRRQLEQQRRRIAEERHIAIELQRAILPLPRGPRILPGLRAAVRYLPAQSQTRVGGDWYEAAALSDDDVFLAIGDVSGHGLQAAAAMARLRGALSGLAFTGAPPDRLLGWLNRLLLRWESLTASAIAAHFDPATRTLSWAQAGHPPPVLLTGGKAILLDQPDGILLGAQDEPRFGLATARLEPGDLLLFYTDGLVERRDQDLTDGFRLLQDAAEGSPGTDPDRVIDHVLAALGAANPNDDTCLLAVQIL